MLNNKWERGHSRGNNVSKGLEVGTHTECLQNNEVGYSKGVQRGGRAELSFGCQGRLAPTREPSVRLRGLTEF